MYQLAVSLLQCCSVIQGNGFRKALSHFLALCVLSQHLLFKRKFWNGSSLLSSHLRLTIHTLFVCISCLSGLCVLNWEDNILKLLFFLISSGIARVCAIELYKLVLNRKGSKICMLAFNFPIVVEYCPNFLNCGFQWQMKPLFRSWFRYMAVEEWSSITGRLHRCLLWQ